MLTTTLSGLRSCLNAQLDCPELDEVFALVKQLPSDDFTINKIMAAAALVDMCSGSSSDVAVNITGNGTETMVFPEGTRGTFAARGVFDGASIAVRHIDDSGNTGIYFLDPFTGANIDMTDQYAFEFAMPPGGTFEFVTTGAGASTDVTITAVALA